MSLREDLFDAIVDIPSIDVHSHMRQGAFNAPDITDVLFYHMVQYPLRSSGVAPEKLWLDEHTFHGKGRPVEELHFHWKHIEHTGFGWALKRILSELYGFEGRLDESAVAELKQVHAQKTENPQWGEEVLQKAKVKNLYTSSFKKGESVRCENPQVGFTLERSPEFGIFEFFSWTGRFQKMEKFTNVPITSYKSLKNVNYQQYDRFDWANKHAVVWWVSSCADFTPVDDNVIDKIIVRCNREEKLTLQEEGLLEAAYIRSVCDAVRERTNVFQLVFGTQFLTPGAHPVQRAVPQFIGTLGHLFHEFPDLHFNVLNGFEPDEPQLCSLCLAYGNVSLGSFWWQTFYPSIMHNGWHRRLDMVPLSRLVGFFSDAYMVDWLFGRLRLTQHVLSAVLAEKIERGFYSFDQALYVAKMLMYETPRALFQGK